MLGTNHHFIMEHRAIKILEGYGIPYPQHCFARSSDEAVAGAEAMGYPVVLKVVSPHVVHKSDAGGVVMGLKSAGDVHRGFEEMVARVKVAVPNADIQGGLVCKQAEDGFEVIVGALDDAVFGPTVMFGLGGVFAEVFKDVTFRVTPLDRIDAQEMIQETKGYSILTGLRGQKPKDMDALINLIMGVSRLVTDRTEIQELDLNPVRLYEEGLVVLDVRVVEK